MFIQKLYLILTKNLILRIMIRFVEMKGIYLDDNKKSFGFYNTVTDTFVGLADNTYVFDSIDEFEELYNSSCNVDYDRLKSLIPNDWVQNEESL